MKKGCMMILVIVAVCGMAFFFYVRRPIISSEWTRQSLYLWWLNCWHHQTNNARPTAMLIDDDCGNGIYTIKRVCDETGIKATFAVIPSRLDSAICNSLKQWQQEGFAMALHGYNHNRWKGWTTEDIIDDITRSEELLAKVGLRKKMEFVVPPHACNTSSIRKAIRLKGYKMVTGANIVNPDTTIFQYGRVFITKDTDLETIGNLLEETKRKRQFIIFGTHSSMYGEFSENKTREVIKMTKKLGFKFI